MSLLVDDGRSEDAEKELWENYCEWVRHLSHTNPELAEIAGQLLELAYARTRDVRCRILRNKLIQLLSEAKREKKAKKST